MTPLPPSPASPPGSQLPPPSPGLTVRENALQAPAAITPLAHAPAPVTLTPEQADAVRALVAGAWADETKRAYRRGWRVFSEWCGAQGFAPMPAHPLAVAAFVEHLVGTRCSMSNVTVCLSAVRWCHEAAKLPSPTESVEVRLAREGAARKLGTAPKRQKSAATLTEIRRLLAQVDRKSLAGKRDAALLLTGFHAALRRSELVAIEVEHLRAVPDGLALHIPRSKTDQQGQGETIGIATMDDPWLCAVAALRAWTAAACIERGAVFRGFTWTGGIRPDGLNPAEVARIVKEYATAAGLDARKFAGHSLRAGFVTEAFRRGAGEIEVMGTTRHRNASTLARYRREADPIARGASKRMRGK